MSGIVALVYCTCMYCDCNIQVRGIIYERVDLGTLHYFCSIGQYLDSTEWIPLMQQITDATEFLHESDVIHQVRDLLFTRFGIFVVLCWRLTEHVIFRRFVLNL